MNKLFHMFTVVLAIVLNLFLINPVLAAASFNITIISESDQAQNAPEALIMQQNLRELRYSAANALPAPPIIVRCWSMVPKSSRVPRSS